MFSQQNRSRLKQAVLSLLVGSLLAGTALADPCGMVPPVYNGPGIPITRIGEQQTYVFYKDGVETFVIRPGFQGKVDEFGMLIPFPTPPAIRKVSDHIFPHVAAAVDPPEVVIDLRPQFFAEEPSAYSAAQAEGLAFERAKKDEVKVLKQEAVGMYEVAVLAAGSSQALKKWMDQQGYNYPKGMDKVCDEYIDLDWCFVAVKTKVGQKEGVDPKPGQRKVDSKLPQGSTFDGFVQAMGFRFKTEKLVVPMRLSAFNAGELRNIVYILTDGPRKIRSIPEEYVMRQLTGTQLAKNVTDPLPLRIIGGTEKDLTEWHVKDLKQRRDPTPMNGAAKELFASDLLAVSTGELSLAHEEQEKQLLAVGERLGLRGGEVDKLHAEVLKKESEKTIAARIKDLAGMTMTVVDGDFPREVLGAQNLTFAEYKMPARRNNTESYDTNTKQPGGKKDGILKLGHFELPKGKAMYAKKSQAKQSWILWSMLAAAVGMSVVVVRKTRRAKALCVGVAIALAVSASQAATLDELVKQFDDTKQAEAAVAEFVKNSKADDGERETIIAALAEVAKEDESNVRRGWALVALGEIGGKDVDALLTSIHNDASQSNLVRTWAAAARIAMTTTTDGLVEKAALISQFPALGRPIGMRIVEQMTKEDESASPEALIAIRNKMPPEIQQALGPAIMGLGAEKLASVLTQGEDQEVRLAAAGYLGALFNGGDTGVPAAVVKVYKFNPDAKEVVWKGGPLYIPGIGWQQDDARALVDNLLRWHLFCDLNGKSGEKQQIHNNLFSISLIRVAGYEQPIWHADDTVRWLSAWAKVIGKEKMLELLKEQKVEDQEKYKKILG